MPAERSRSLILILVLASFFMKLLWIGHKELAHDEPFTVLQAHRTIQGLFTILPEENNPPLHFILVHLWAKLVPMEAEWLRLPSVLFSALTVWPLFLLGSAFGGIRTAVVASLLFIFSSYHFGFAHEVRAYSLFALLATTSMWQLHRVVQGRGIGWLVLIDVLLVYTHFFGLLMIGIQLLCVFLVKEWRPRKRSLIITLLITLAAYLPYASIFLLRFNTSVGKGTWLTTPSPEELYNMVWRWSNVPVATVFLLAIILIHCIRTRCRLLGTRVGLIWAFVPLLGMFLASQFVPMFLDRYLIYASTGFYLLCAIALENGLRSQNTSKWLSATAVGIFAFTFTPYDNSWPRPSKVIVAVAEMRDEQHTTVLIHPWWYSHTFAWHTNKELFREPDLLDEKLGVRGVHALADLDQLATTLNEEQELILIVAGAEEERQFNAVREHHDLQIMDSREPHQHVHVYRLKR